MQCDPRIVAIPTQHIEEIPWLMYRQDIDGAAEREGLVGLAHSMRPPELPAAGAAGTSVDLPIDFRPPAEKGPAPRAALEQLAVGQVAPIRVLKYPPELGMEGKPFGLVFGYRRWTAAKLAGLPTIQAQVVALTYAEYQSPYYQYYLRLMSLAENDQRKPLAPYDRIMMLRDMEERYYTLFPAARKAGRPRAMVPIRRAASGAAPGGRNGRSGGATTGPPTLTVHEGGAVAHDDPPPFDRVAAAATNRARSAIRTDLLLARRLAIAAFDLMQRNSLSPGAARQLVRLPETRQTHIIGAILARGQSVNERTIRQEIAREKEKGARQRQLGTGNRLTEVRVRPPSPRALTAPCRDECQPCLLETAPLDCIHIQRIAQHLETAAALSLDLHLRFAWTDALVQVLLPHVSSLSEAASDLEYHLRHPDEYAKFNPVSLPHYTPRAAAQVARAGR